MGKAHFCSISRVFRRIYIAPEDSRTLALELGRDNRDRGRLVLLALILWFGFNLVMDVVAFVPAGQMFYLWFDLSAVPILIAFYLVLQLTESPLVSLRASNLFGSVLLVSAAVLSAVQGSALTFVIACYIVAAAVYMRMWVAVGNYALALIAYFVARFIVAGVATGDLVHSIEVLAAGFFAFVVSRALFRSRLKTFVAQQKVRELTETQDRIIQERTRELESANRRLQERMREREVLVQEIHHRVNNNLQLLASFVHIATARARDAEVERVCAGMEDRILAMAMVHQRMHESDSLERVRMDEYLPKVTEKLTRSLRDGRRYAVRIRVSPIDLDIERAIHFGLIVTEVLTNSFTHGFHGDRDDYAVDVDLEVRDGRLQLLIRDNGDASPGDIPAAGDPMSGLGLLVIDALAAQDGGSYEYEADGGAVFRFSAPL